MLNQIIFSVKYLHRLTSVSDEYSVRSHFELMYIDVTYRKFLKEDLKVLRKMLIVRIHLPFFLYHYFSHKKKRKNNPELK